MFHASRGNYGGEPYYQGVASPETKEARKARKKEKEERKKAREERRKEREEREKRREEEEKKAREGPGPIHMLINGGVKYLSSHGHKGDKQ